MATTAQARLNYGNAIRIERARLKRMLKSGNLTLTEAFEEDAFCTMLLYDLLLALPSRLGTPAVARRRVTKATLLATSLFAHIQRSPLVRVGELTARERRILAYAYRRYQEGTTR